jgi:flagella basal body P-ring formation protein FlgA
MMSLVLLAAIFLSPGLGAAPQRPSCLPVSGDWIHARDLVPAVPEFSQLPPDYSLGYTPTPGVERVFLAGELQRIAKQQHVETSIRHSICLAWPTALVEKERILAAMRASLGGRQTKIEILDQSRAFAPAGDLVFPLQGLSAFSDKPAVWNGYVAFSPTRRFSTWALVRVRVTEQHWVAVKEIHAGDGIAAASFKSETYEGPLLRDTPVQDLTALGGLRAARNIPPGATLFSGMLVPPQEVQKGEAVKVVAEAGSTRLETEGLAIQGGTKGEIILVKNARSGSLFKARVTGKGQVLVVPSLLSGLVGEGKKL